MSENPEKEIKIDKASKNSSSQKSSKKHFGFASEALESPQKNEQEPYNNYLEDDLP